MISSKSSSCATVAALAERSQPIDLVTLKDELARLSALEAVGGAAYLAGLLRPLGVAVTRIARGVPVGANTPHQMLDS